MRTTTPITSRPVDLVYFIFFLVHIPATLLIDLQALYRPSLTPDFIRTLPQLYVQMSNDPLIGGALNLLGDSKHLIWFKTFLALEAFFQLPVFVLGARGLFRDSRCIYVLLLIYAASTSTTILPCISVLMLTPITSAQTIADNVVSVTTSQLFLLLSSYIPFCIIPFFMTVDMAFRVLKLIKIGIDTADVKKLS